MTEKQRSEKLRLMRLEKNRRTAAVSRERKKLYLKSLEERILIMSKYQVALELENSQLRHLLGQNNIPTPNTMYPAQPNLLSLEPPSFDSESNPTNSTTRKRPFTAMMDMNILNAPDAAEGVVS